MSATARPQLPRATPLLIDPPALTSLSNEGLKTLVTAIIPQISEAWWIQLASKASPSRLNAVPEVVDLTAIDYRKKHFGESRFRNIPPSLQDTWPHQLDFVTLRVVAVAGLRQIYIKFSAIFGSKLRIRFCGNFQCDEH